MTPPGNPPEEWKFISELRSPPVFDFADSGASRDAGDGLNLRRGLRLAKTLPPSVPETAAASLRGFLKRSSFPDGGSSIRFEECATECPEAFSIRVEKVGIAIRAADPEGFRRGIYELEKLLLSSDAGELPPGTLTRRPWLKYRISRCYFGPIKRPPFNRDELADDFDYYPEAYLERLAFEGINALWLTVSLAELAATSFYMPTAGAAARLAKLRETARKCKRYGIRIFIFCVEPSAALRPEDLFERFPEMAGVEAWGLQTFCAAHGKTLEYIRESVRSIFRAVPELGGMINISYGERVTSCLSSVSQTEDRGIECASKCGLDKPEIYRRLTEAMRDGMKEASPEAELISWFYMAAVGERGAWLWKTLEKIPEHVIFQYNFESNCTALQLGKIRHGGDYWISHAAPSADFEKIAQLCGRRGIGLSAKIQVSCSHELATVPVIPVPALLFDKFRQMKKLGVSSAMLCWYFGSCPGLMNRAAGELAFDTPGVETDRMSFLRKLARTVWHGQAERVACAWEKFSDSFSLYPLSNMFQYYGPVHSGAIWDLRYDMEAEPLAPTWKTGFPSSGDAIGECLQGHSLEEAVLLLSQMAEKWKEGLELLREANAATLPDKNRREELSCAEAAGLQIGSAARILRFYALRRNADAPARIEMGRIVEAELAARIRLAELCRKDSRLGFHSEAEAYMYDAGKIEASLPHLMRIAEKIRSGPPEKKDRAVYRLNSSWCDCLTFRWKMDERNGQTVFRLEITADLPDRVFEAAFSDEWLSECVRFLRFNKNGVISDDLDCAEAGWLNGSTFEARFAFPCRNPAGSVSCAIGPHDRETMLDAWPPRPNHEKPPLRLKLRYFHPVFCGLFRQTPCSDSKKEKD